MDISSNKQIKSPTRRPGYLRKGNLQKETESLQIIAQNNAITTNYVKIEITKTQQNSKSGDRDETINYIMNECCKLVQKEYKT